MSVRFAPDGKVWYLAGPMSGIPQFNYPLFFRVANALRNSGYEIISPAEQDSDEELQKILASPDGDLSKVPSSQTWGDFLSHDVKLIADKVDGIVFLPGWYKSRGARLEAYVGLTCDRPFMEVDFFNDEILLSDLAPTEVKRRIFDNV